MNLIDRYVYAVMEHLPNDIREDIGKELRANIEDMLPDDYTDEDVYQVLMNLGSPWKLANEYNPQKRYLIGPGYYDKYISTLKMVIGICISVFVGIGLLGWVIESPIDGHELKNVTKLITELISSGISGAFQGIFWVTLVFIILERSGVEDGNIPFFNKKWTPDDLLKLPINDNRKISRGETVFSIFFTILFTALISIQPQLIAIYIKGENGRVNSAALFDIERLKFYIPIILILAFFQLAVLIWKYITGRWKKSLVIINVVYNVAISILAIVMLSDKALFNTEFISIIADMGNVSKVTISIWIVKSKWIVGLVFIVICIWDSIITSVKCLRKN